MFAGPLVAAPTATILRWTKVSGGAGLPVSLDALKDFTARPRQDTFWDQELEGFIRVAQAAIENDARIQLTAGVWQGVLPQFYERIRITRRPFVDVTKIEYVDPSTGEITEVDPDIYQVQDEGQDIGMIYLGDSLQWPATARRRDAVRVTVKAGFATTEEESAAGYSELPVELAHAVLMTVAALEKARGDTEASTGNVTVYAMKNSKGGGLVPAEARALISPYIYRQVTVV